MRLRYSTILIGFLFVLIVLLGYALARGVRPQVNARYSEPAKMLLSIGAIMRARAAHQLDHVLSPDHAAVAAGIVLGSKESLREGIIGDFRRTGLAHVLVASGYNVFIITALVERLGLVFRLRPRRRGVFVLAAAILFVAVTGFDPAAMRAGFMSVVVVCSRLLRRPIRPALVLLWAVFGALLFDPMLINRLGFLLSVAATVGLLYAHPHIKRMIGNIPFIYESIQEIISTTLAVELMVLPLILMYFGTVSLVMLPANLLILPIIPWVMCLSFGLIALGWVPIVNAVLAWCASILIAGILAVVDWLANLSWAQINVAEPTVFITLSYYICVAFLLAVRTRKEEVRALRV